MIRRLIIAVISIILLTSPSSAGCFLFFCSWPRHIRHRPVAHNHKSVVIINKRFMIIKRHTAARRPCDKAYVPTEIQPIRPIK